MQRSCSNCGAEIFPGARFCRRCGALQREPGDGTGDVSPQASTVPLRVDESRTTDGLGEDEQRASADTSRVSQAEMERLLRTQQDAERQRETQSGASPSSSELAGVADERARRDSAESAHESEATLVASSPQTRPGTTSAAQFGEEELTITVPRPSQPFETRETSADFRRATRVPLTTVHEIAPADAQGEGVQAPAQASGAAATRVVTTTQASANAARPSVASRRRWPVVVAVCAVVLLFAVAAALLGWRLLRRPSLAELPAQAPTATPAPDAVQQFEEKLAEAESLLAQGNMDGAIALLREANALDPANTRAHRRLGELLIASGARREAIEEFRAVTRNAPDDTTAWRQLGGAQFAEGVYRDAAESYHRLIELTGGEQSADPNDLLAYADALKLSGRIEEARAVYERVAASPQTDVAGIARQRLAELAQSQPAPSPSRRPGETQNTNESETASVVTPAPTPAPTPVPMPAPQTASASVGLPASASPAEHYHRGVELWSSNRSAALNEFRAAASGGNPDAHYYLGLSYVEGRDMHALKRAEVVAALQHFQIAERGGQHAAEARSYAQQLEKEFDRLRKQ
jgi:tetratricopeptide (TPR) repeat protein